MKKAAIIILAVLILAVGGVSAYVAMIDWNEHKDQIAAQFSEVSGKRVVFEGPVSFKDFSVAGPDRLQYQGLQPRGRQSGRATGDH